MRVGLTSTPCRRSSEPGTSEAASRNGAADEKSPGTSIEKGLSDWAGQTLISLPTFVTRTPAARSIRSVWSRVASGSTTIVGPSSAKRPASRIADLTWALATGSS